MEQLINALEKFENLDFVLTSLRKCAQTIDTIDGLVKYLEETESVINITPEIAIHCTKAEHLEYLVSKGYVEENVLYHHTPIWINIKKDGHYGWMPEKNSHNMTGKSYFEARGFKCVEFAEIIQN